MPETPASPAQNPSLVRMKRHHAQAMRRREFSRRRSPAPRHCQRTDVYPSVLSTLATRKTLRLSFLASRNPSYTERGMTCPCTCACASMRRTSSAVLTQQRSGRHLRDDGSYQATRDGAIAHGDDVRPESRGELHDDEHARVRARAPVPEQEFRSWRKHGQRTLAMTQPHFSDAPAVVGPGQ